MKFKSLFICAAIMSTTFAACSSDSDSESGKGGDDDGILPPTTEISGNVEGTWEANSVIKVSGHIVVPEGKTLTIKEGVQVIFSDNGVGVNHVPIAFTVNANL